MLTLLTETELSASYSSPSFNWGFFFARTWKSFAVGFSNGDDPNRCNSPLSLATLIFSCLAKSSQFAVGPLNMSSPFTISLKRSLSKADRTSFLSSSGLGKALVGKIFKKL